MKQPVISERKVQRSIIKECGKIFPQVFMAHVPNGAHLAGTAGPLLGDGMRKGFPDLIVLWNHGVGFLEVKNSKGGTTSPDQVRMHEYLTSIGHRVAVVTSDAEAQEALLSWGAPCIARAA